MTRNDFPSFWQRQSLPGHLDVLILGGGIVGLSAGISFRERHPQWRVAVLERGSLPAGASVKNAGFACFGSPSELLDDLSRMSEEKVFALVERRFRGLQMLRQRLGDERIGYEASGGWEIFGDDNSENDVAGYRFCRDALPGLNENMRRAIGQEVYFSADEKISSMGFGGVSHMIGNRGEGILDTGKMMQALHAFALEKGVMFFGGAEVDFWEHTGKEIRVCEKGGTEFRTDKLLICTNGFAHRWLPGELMPARAQVLITNPLPELPFAGGFHYDKGYYYFRNVGNRVLFGGGRNLDFASEETDEQGLTEIVQSRLEKMLREMILPGREFSIDMRWSGTMGVGPEKSPIIREMEPGVFCAVRMGGMGVALGSLVGEEVAVLMS